MGKASVGRIRAAAGVVVALATIDILGSRPTVPEADGQLEPRPQRGTNAIGSYQIVGVYPHDPEAFTQGLVYDQGALYEGTGRRGASSVRKIDLRTGRVLQSAALPPTQFGEGITILGDRLYQLTWLSGMGTVYDRETLRPLAQFHQFTEGWGLTHDARYLIMSDGSSRLFFLDPDTLVPVREIEVTDASRPIDQINELEFIDGSIYANVWHRDEILRIAPDTGEVLGRIDMAGLIDPGLLNNPEAVLNGIAYDAVGDRIFVTGKLWPRLFEVRFLENR